MTTCQICEREIKAKIGRIAHHGYERPDRGSGWQTASCWGARHLPYEQSCDQIRPCIQFIVKYVERQHEMLKELMESPPDTLQSHFNQKEATRPEDFDAQKNVEYEERSPANVYKYEHCSRVRYHKREISGSLSEITRLQKRLDAWKPTKS